jgi:hypothetical protein
MLFFFKSGKGLRSCALGIGFRSFPFPTRKPHFFPLKKKNLEQKKKKRKNIERGSFGSTVRDT